MFRAFPLVLGSVLLLLPVSAFMTEPPQDHEEWRGSLGALWMHYPFDCTVWNEGQRQLFACHDDSNTVTLTINPPSTDPFLSLEGTVLGKTGKVRAIKQGNTLTLSGMYDDQYQSLPLTVEGTAKNFTFSGAHEGTPFQGKGSSTQDALTLSLSFVHYIPLTGTLELRRTDSPADLPSSSTTTSIALAPPRGTGTALSATGTTPPSLDLASDLPPPFPILSSGTIERAAQDVIDRLEDSGQSFSRFSRFLTLVLQTIFAALAVLLLVTFGFLLHHLKNQRSRGDTPK